MELVAAKQILVPLVLFLCITFAFKTLLDTVARYRMLKEGLSQTVLADMLAHDAVQRRLAALRWGILLISIGLALALLQAFGWTKPSAGSFALLAVFTGIGQLVYYRLTRKNA
jgi:Domain of unknown function (DUF6249)